MSKTTDTSVVIYGGGMAGGLLARKLSSKVHVRLVDPLPFFEIPMAAPRNLVEPAFADKAVFAFSEALPDVEHIAARLVEFTTEGDIVEDADGKRTLVTGGVSVLATGSRFANELVRATSGSMLDRKAYYRRFHDRLKNAQRVLIVGGGPIGVEIAGEILETWPGKKVTLVEAGPRLLAGTSETAATHAADFLRQRGVDIVLGERLQFDGGTLADPFGEAGSVVTSTGRELAYDLLVWSIGGRPNTAYMTPHFADSLDAAGRIKVGPDLRVPGLERVFAIGDITDLDENKMAAHIKGQLPVAEANILSILEGLPPAKTYQAKTGNPMMALTLGKRAGVVHLPPLGVFKAKWIARKIKAENMLVPLYRKALGLGR
jgi:NADH dehydrogenase FAD-containing subunit